MSKATKKGFNFSLKKLLILVLFVFVLLLVCYGIAVYFVTRSALSSGQQHLTTAISTLKVEPLSSLKVSDLERAGVEFRAAREDFSKARLWLKPVSWLIPSLGALFGRGADARALTPLLDTAINASDAGSELCLGLNPALAQLGKKDDGPAVPMGQRMLFLSAAIKTGQPHIQIASADLERVSADRTEIEASQLTSYSMKNAVSQVDKSLPRVRNMVRSLLDLPAILSTLLGEQGPQTYLVIAQNNDEQRPTGGFISTAGLLRISQGQMSVSDFKDSYAFDNPRVYSSDHPSAPPAPGPLAHYMGSSYLTLRDANWSPDFPTTARTIEGMYNLDTSPQSENLAGVISVDIVTLKYIVAAVGTLELNIGGRNVSVDGNNVISLLQLYFQSPADSTKDPTWWEHRKDFTGVLFKAIIDKTIHSDHEHLVAFLGAVQKSVTEKHILLYFQDERSASALALNDWDGAFSSLPSGTDYLALIDANVGFNKVNPHISQVMEYDLNLEGANTEATTTITYTNSASGSGECVLEAKYGNSYADMADRCYWDYLRLYRPPETILISASGFNDKPGSGSDLGRATLEGYLIVPRGASRTIVFTSTVAPALLQNLKEGHYTLILQQQAGLPQSYPLAVRLHLPPGYSLKSYPPEIAMSLNGSTLNFTVTMDSLKQIDLFFAHS